MITDHEAPHYALFCTPPRHRFPPQPKYLSQYPIIKHRQNQQKKEHVINTRTFYFSACSEKATVYYGIEA